MRPPRRLEADKNRACPCGGGTRGAAHVGVLRVLEREGIHIDMISGTSIGAIVGGLYSAGLSVDEIEAQFRSQIS